MADKNTQQETQKPSIKDEALIIGAGNVTPVTLLTDGVVLDSMPRATNGMNKVGVVGMNGKRQATARANPFLQDIDMLKQNIFTANAVKVGGTLIEGTRVEFPHPDDANKLYRVIFDNNRSKENPIAIFELTLQDKEIEVNKKKKTVKEVASTTKLKELPEFSKIAKLQNSDVKTILQKIAQTLQNLESYPEIITKLKELDLLKPNTEEKAFAFIQAVSESATPEDVEKINAQIKEVLGDKAIPIEYITLENARTSHFVVVEGLKQEDVKRMTEAVTYFGVDEKNNIVVIEDTNIPYQSGAVIYDKYVKSNNPVLAEAIDLQKKINVTIHHALHKLDAETYKKPDMPPLKVGDLAKAEQTLSELTKKSLKEKNKVENFENWLSNEAEVVNVVAKDDVTARELFKAKEIIATIKTMISESRARDTFAEPQKHEEMIVDSYMKDGRMLGVANSSPKKVMFPDFEKKETIVLVNENLPMLSRLGEDNIVNAKNIKVPMYQIKFDENGKAIDIGKINTLGAYLKKQKLIRVLSALKNLKPSGDEDKDKALSKLFAGYIQDGTLDDKGNANGFGLGQAIKDAKDTKRTAVKVPTITKFIKELQSIVFTDDGADYTPEAMAKVREAIDSLVDSDNPNLAELGKAVEMMSLKNERRDKYLNNASSRALTDWADPEANEKVKKVVLDVINGNIPEKITDGVMYSATLLGAKLKEEIQGVLKNDEKQQVMLDVAKNMFFKAREVKKFTLIKSTSNGIFPTNRFYAQELKKFNNVEVEIDDEKKYAVKLDDIKATLKYEQKDYQSFVKLTEEIKNNYNENKVNPFNVFEDIDVDLGIDVGAMLKDEGIDEKVADELSATKKQGNKKDADANELEELAQKEADAELDSIDSEIDAYISAEDGDLFAEEEIDITSLVEDNEEEEKKMVEQAQATTIKI